jgi:diguanylate cyclase (GGDEF)-like protein
MTSRPSSSNDLLKPLVLFVNEDPSLQEQWRQWLKQEGYQVVEARTSGDAVVEFQKQHPDLVIVTLFNEPASGQDSLDFCQQLLSLSGGEYTPTLLVTDCDHARFIDTAFELGVAGFITKPVFWNVLRHQLRRLIRQNQQLRQLETENQQLKRLATLDSLTRIPNRRRFDEHLEAMWRQMVRDNDWLALVLADVDFFKTYNDTYGHLAGDRCLQTIAETLSHCCYRPMDLLARYGGEEFSIILPQTDMEGALSLVERIQAKIKALSLPHPESSLGNQVTLSFGVTAIQPRMSLLPDVLLETADEALYQAKSAGRNGAVGLDVKFTD